MTHLSPRVPNLRGCRIYSVLERYLFCAVFWFLCEKFFCVVEVAFVYPYYRVWSKMKIEGKAIGKDWRLHLSSSKALYFVSVLLILIISGKFQSYVLTISSHLMTQLPNVIYKNHFSLYELMKVFLNQNSAKAFFVGFLIIYDRANYSLIFGYEKLPLLIQSRQQFDCLLTIMEKGMSSE